MMRRRIGVLRQRRNVKAADIEDVDYIAKIESGPGAFGTIRPLLLLPA
jgi:hypothetical protein